MWFEFLGDLREHGVTTPVIPGIMPVLNVKSVKRMAEMSGADFPRALESRLRAVEDDEDAMRAVGIEATTELCRDLMAGGVDSFHFYTLNRSSATREIYDNLGFGSFVECPDRATESVYGSRHLHRARTPIPTRSRTSGRWLRWPGIWEGHDGRRRAPRASRATEQQRLRRALRAAADRSRRRTGRSCSTGCATTRTS